MGLRTVGERLPAIGQLVKIAAEGPERSNRPLIPVAGYTFNQYFQQCAQYKSKGLQCAAGSFPATLGAQAITEAVGLIEERDATGGHR